MIEIEGLTKKFGDVTAVEGLTLRVEDGEVFGFLGPNGAGKTTTVRMLAAATRSSKSRERRPVIRVLRSGGDYFGSGGPKRTSLPLRT